MKLSLQANIEGFKAERVCCLISFETHTHTLDSTGKAAFDKGILFLLLLIR